MLRNPDEQVFAAASGLGCSALNAGLIILPPLLLPGFIIFRLAQLSGATSLHPAFQIALAAATIFALWRLGGMVIRSVPPTITQGLLGLYIGACYTFAIFQRELTTARSELDVPWLLLTFGICTYIGWKIAAMLVLKAYRDQLARARARQVET